MSVPSSPLFMPAKCACLWLPADNVPMMTVLTAKIIMQGAPGFVQDDPRSQEDINMIARAAHRPCRILVPFHAPMKHAGSTGCTAHCPYIMFAGTKVQAPHIDHSACSIKYSL